MGKKILVIAGIWLLGTIFLAQLMLCGQANSRGNLPETVYAATDGKKLPEAV